VVPGEGPASDGTQTVVRALQAHITYMRIDSQILLCIKTDF